jgi:prolyl-tRNA editing enzyme YbaK/EbsC (Cys-tRNA(Pro) deacylase)
LDTPRPLRTLVDRTLEQYAEVWAAAGIPHSVVPISFTDLVKATGGVPADVA